MIVVECHTQWRKCECSDFFEGVKKWDANRALLQSIIKSIFETANHVPWPIQAVGWFVDSDASAAPLVSDSNIGKSATPQIARVRIGLSCLGKCQFMSPQGIVVPNFRDDLSFYLKLLWHQVGR